MKKPAAVQRQTLSNEISTWTEIRAIHGTRQKLITNTKSLCQKGGFRLQKFPSNSSEVMSSVPEEDRATGPKDHRLISNYTTVEHAPVQDHSAR